MKGIGSNTGGGKKTMLGMNAGRRKGVELTCEKVLH
jgi:hypothetical protein